MSTHRKDNFACGVTGFRTGMRGRILRNELVWVRFTISDMLACRLQCGLPVMNKAVFLSTVILVATSSYAATISSSFSCEIGYHDLSTGVSEDYRMQGPSSCAVTDGIQGSSSASIGLTTSLPANPAATFSTVSASFTEETASHAPSISSIAASSFARATGNFQFSTGLIALGAGDGYLAVTIPGYRWSGDNGNNSYGTFGFSIGEMFSFACTGVAANLNCSVDPLSRSTWPVESQGTEIRIPVTLGQTFVYSISGTIGSGGSSMFGAGVGYGYLSPEFSFYAADGTTPVLMEQVPEPGTWWMLGIGIAGCIAAGFGSKCRHEWRHSAPEARSTR
ncbi:MAG TPA: PEP-CTERM sorting domain-containing protein [Bryobacteraceae bacterium]|nr:PEP-CTERM sorting domain-containing protein [Bryobacteraceae bacterium]